MRKSLVVSAAILLGCTALPAQSADNGFYFGGSVGAGGVKFDDRFDGQQIDYDAGSTGYKVIAGWRFLDWLAVEANYVDLGSGEDKVQGETIETDVSGASLSAVGFLPIGPVDVFARAGAIDWSADVTLSGLDLKGSDDGTDFTYGVGVQFRVWSLSFRAEYELFDIADADTVDLASIGVTWTFL
jgi:opacity protein-like surface antigen